MGSSQSTGLVGCRMGVSVMEWRDRTRRRLIGLIADLLTKLDKHRT